MRYSFFILFLIGCAAPKPISQTQERDSVTIIREKLVPVTVPAAEANISIDMSELEAIVEKHKPGTQTRIIYKEDKRASINVYLDSLGNLVAEANCWEEEFQMRIKELETVVTQRNTTIVEQRKSFGDRIEELIGKIVIFGAIAIGLIIIVPILIRKFL